MFEKEFKVKGEKVKGQIISNWSNRSYYALKVSELSEITLGAEDLEKLIDELKRIEMKIRKLNLDHVNDY